MNAALLRRLLGEPRVVAGFLMAATVLALAFVGPYATPFEPTQFVGRPFQPASAASPLGTDVLGRDVLSALLVGGRAFLVQGILATLLGVGLGVVLGTMLALMPRRSADLVLSASDTVVVLPQIVIALLVLTRLGSTPATLIAVIGVVHIPQTARVIRAAAQRVVTADYFLAARALGTPRRRLFTGEILPNIAAPVAVELSIRLAISVVVLASLGYLGFGATRIEWGRMIHDNQGGLSIQPWAVMAPVAAIGVFLIGANMLRDGITRTLLPAR